MTISGWTQLVLYVIALLAITKPVGIYLCQVLDAEGKTFLDPVLKPLEGLTYKLTGVDPRKEQDWKHYTLSMLLFSAVGLLFTYAILRLQAVLPFQNLLDPQNLPAVGEHLSFNTAASFTTNTNWQSYGGESTMSYLSQMVALTFHNWVSAATGIAIAAALVRGIARHTAKTIGNFWTRSYARLPLSASANLPDLLDLPRLAGYDPEFQALHLGVARRAVHRASSKAR